jgi:hypothetical protein
MAVFERYFLEGQEQYPMRVIGQFRNQRDPSYFVWLRGFADMERRREALEGFYRGPVWKAHSAAANDTMIDSDNVLLLKPARNDSGFRLSSTVRPALDAAELAHGGLFVLTIHYFEAPVDGAFLEFFGAEIAPALQAAGAPILAQFVTESSPNTFTALPVRARENVFVWVTSFASQAAYQAHRAALESSRDWQQRLAPALRARSPKPEEVLELVPGARSLLRHDTHGTPPQG